MWLHIACYARARVLSSARTQTHAQPTSPEARDRVPILTARHRLLVRGIQPFGHLYVRTRVPLAVAIHRDGDTRVAKPLLDGLWMLAVRDHERRCRMP